MGPGEAMVVIGLLSILPMIVILRYFKLREKTLEFEAVATVGNAAHYASRSTELEARVRILEQIVTDTGAQTAAQIEALRNRPALTNGDKVQ